MLRRRGVFGLAAVASAGAVRKRPGSVASHLSSSAAGFSCGIRQRPMRASAIPRAWSKSASEARQASRCSDRDCNGPPSAGQSVHPAGMSERLPSGSTTSKNSVPRRLMVPITGNERPSNGCRSRKIVTKVEMSRKWVVCDGFLRQYRLGAFAQGCPSPYGLSVGSALHRALAEGPDADGGWQRRAANVRNSTGRCREPHPGESVPALRVRHVDAENLSSYPVRAIRGRCHLSLQGRRGGEGTLARDCGPPCGLQAGSTSAEDQDRLLQGCEPARRLPRYPLRL